VQTNVLFKEECVLKNKNKLCPFKKLSVFYKSCLKTFGSHLVCDIGDVEVWCRLLVYKLLYCTEYFYRLTEQCRAGGIVSRYAVTMSPAGRPYGEQFGDKKYFLF
jgi:hypothetical protein